MISVSIPKSIIQSHADIWPSFAVSFVLRENVCEWLAENDMSISIDYTCFYDSDEGAAAQYVAHFNSEADAILFRLRWGFS